MIKALIFDYNGVLTTRGNFQELISQYGKKAPELERLVVERWDLARVGKSDFWPKIASYLKLPEDQVRQEWIAQFPLRSELLEKITQYKAKYKTALLTNEIKDWLEESISKNELHDYFDTIVTSYETGFAKPDPRIFLLTLNRLGVKAEECVFIDDQAKNTTAAADLGFKVIQFISVEQMEEEMRVLLGNQN